MLQRLHLAYGPQRRTFAMAVGSHTVRIWSQQSRLFHLGEDPTSCGYSLEMDTGHMGLIGLDFLDDDTLLCVHADGVLQVWSLNALDQPSETFEIMPEMSAQGIPTMGRLELFGRARRVERASTTMRAILSWELHIDALLDACDIALVRGRLRVVLGGTLGEVYWVEILRNLPPIAVHIGQLERGVSLARLSPAADRAATVCRDRTIAIWRPLEELPIDEATGAWRTLDETGGEILSLAFSESGRYLAGGGADHGVYLWDMRADKALRAVSYDHEGRISDLAWSPEDRVLACASWDNTVGLFRGADLSPLYCFEHHEEHVAQVMFAPNSNHLISAGHDRRIAVWDWRNAALVKEFREHQDWVLALEWMGQGLFLSAAADRNLRIWSSATLSCEVILGEGSEEDWMRASLGSSSEGLDRPSVTTGGFKTIRPTEQAAHLDATLRRALASTEEVGLGAEVSVLFDALTEDEKLATLARGSSPQSSSRDSGGPPSNPRLTLAGVPGASRNPELDDANAYMMEKLELGDRLSSEISSSEGEESLVEESLSIVEEDEEPSARPSFSRGGGPTEHSGLFALEYSEGTIARLRSPFAMSNSGLLDLQEASIVVDLSEVRFPSTGKVQFESEPDDQAIASTLRTPKEQDSSVARDVDELPEVDEAPQQEEVGRSVSRAQLRALFKKHRTKSLSEASLSEPSDAPSEDASQPPRSEEPELAQEPAREQEQVAIEQPVVPPVEDDSLLADEAASEPALADDIIEEEVIEEEVDDRASEVDDVDDVDEAESVEVAPIAILGDDESIAGADEVSLGDEESSLEDSLARAFEGLSEPSSPSPVELPAVEAIEEDIAPGLAAEQSGDTTPEEREEEPAPAPPEEPEAPRPVLEFSNSQRPRKLLRRLKAAIEQEEAEAIIAANERGEDEPGLADEPSLVNRTEDFDFGDLDFSFDEKTSASEAEPEPDLQALVTDAEAPAREPMLERSTHAEDEHPLVFNELATIQDGTAAPMISGPMLSLSSVTSDEPPRADDAPTDSNPAAASSVAQVDANQHDAFEQQEEAPALPSDSGSGTPSGGMKAIFHNALNDFPKSRHEQTSTVAEDDLFARDARVGRTIQDAPGGFSRPHDEQTKRAQPLTARQVEPPPAEPDPSEHSLANLDQGFSPDHVSSGGSIAGQSPISGPGVMLPDGSESEVIGESISMSSSSFDLGDVDELDDDISHQEVEHAFGVPDASDAPSLETHSAILKPIKRARSEAPVEPVEEEDEEPIEGDVTLPPSVVEEDDSETFDAGVPPVQPYSGYVPPLERAPHDTTEFPALDLSDRKRQESGPVDLSESTPAYVEPVAAPPGLATASFADEIHSPKKNTRPGLNPLRGDQSSSSAFRNALDMSMPENAVNSTMLGMSNFIYKPGSNDESSMGQEEPPPGFPEVSEALSQPEITDLTPRLIDVTASQLWMMRMAERKASMKIFKRASTQRSRWRSYDKLSLELGRTFDVVHNSETSLFAAAGARRHVEVWSTREGRLFQLPGRGRAVYSLCATPDGRVLIGGDDRANIHLWLLPSKLGAAPDPAIPRTMLRGHAGPISSLSVNSTGKLLLSGSLDGTARLWSLEDGECLAILDHGGEPLSGVVFWSKGLASTSHEGKLRLWDRRGIQIDLLEGYSTFTSVTSHRSSIYAATSAGLVLRYQRGKSLELVQRSCSVTGVQINPEGTLVAVDEKGGVLLFFNEQDEPTTLETGSPLTCVDFGSDILFAGTEDGNVELFKKV